MAASSSSNVPAIKHDVFISFRGKDVRRGLLSHLKKELRRKQIDVFVDERLERGDEISSSLLRAIEGSHILLVIFSEDYASSNMCLEELAKMIECMERNNQTVIPVFFNVDPSDVRHQLAEYGKAFSGHEINFKEKIFRVQNWRFALKKAAQLSGFHYPTNFEDESDLVDKIVEDVLKKLSKFCLSEPNGLIGITESIRHIELLLATESREVLILGIWGMGGIGKTTIAQAIFDKIYHQYEGYCFLENIREELEKYPLSHLREKLLSELLDKENLHINGKTNVKSLSSFKRWLRRKKVFIVLDDVNTPEQLQYLVGKPICFGPGSVVIVTSRDKHVLTSGGAHEIHEVKELNFQDSLKLFCLNAFNESQPKMGYEELSKKATVNAKGIPLALKILGSHFHSKSKKAWESALRKLEKYPNEEIQSALRLSYDGLDDVEKKILLDIAFFFKEDDSDYIIRQLDAWDFYGDSGIEALQQKALITISNDNRIQMHELIQEMANKIVCQESANPGRRSRLILRDREEVYEVLKNNRENVAVEGMLIDVSQLGDIALSVDAFKKMPNLRFLKFYCPLYLNLLVLPSHVIELLWGVQDFMKLKGSGPSQFKQLVELPKFPKATILECANLNNSNSLQNHVNLMAINVGMSKQLLELTDLSNLEGIYLLDCKSLCEGHPSILFLENHVTSILSGCKEVVSIGSEVHIKSLDYLLIDGCEGPEEFSVSSKEIRQLNLTLTDTRMEILNSSLGHLSNHECSDSDGLLSNESFCLRLTHYLRLFSNGRQETRKPKLHILFDGLRHSRRISLNELYNLLELAVPQNTGVLSWLSELILDGRSVE